MLTDYRARFTHPNITYSQQDALELIHIVNNHGRAILTTYGATLLSYIPVGGEEVLWVSETAVYDGSKPVRGGIPVCWPWFGAHPTDPSKGAHGFARHQVWEVEAIQSVDGDATQVILSLSANDTTRALWPYNFKLTLSVTLGEKLLLELTSHNLSDEEWTISEALHTYFRVGEAEGIVIRGMEGKHYLDKNRDFAEFTQSDILSLNPPMDCVYIDHSGSVAIEDGKREIEVRKRNSATTIVWNPGPEGVKAVTDFPVEQYHHMVCVEAGNALKNSYKLAAGEKHSLSMLLHSKDMISS